MSKRMSKKLPEPSFFFMMVVVSLSAIIIAAVAWYLQGGVDGW